MKDAELVLGQKKNEPVMFVISGGQMISFVMEDKEHYQEDKRTIFLENGYILQTTMVPMPVQHPLSGQVQMQIVPANLIVELKRVSLHYEAIGFLDEADMIAKSVRDVRYKTLATTK